MTRSAWVAATAATVFAAAWVAIHYGPLSHDQIRDTPRYQQWGRAVAHGAVPYRDVSIEYPPGALAPVVAPSLAARGRGSYEHWFEALMLVCGLGLVSTTALTLQRCDWVFRETVARIVPLALLPVLTGTVILSRFDLWPALLTAVGVASTVAGNPLAAGVLFGVGAATKLYPALYAPLMVVYFARRERREAVRAAVAFVAGVAIVVVPFLVVAPHGVLRSFEGQASRPLQIESLGASLALAAHQIYGQPLGLDFSHHSQNLGGHTANALAVLQVVAQAACILALLVAFARGPATAERLVRYVAAATLAFVVLGKVLSPQYLIWIVPLVALVPATRGRLALLLVALATAITQVWFPQRYWRLVLHFDAIASWALLCRNLLLLAALGVLVIPRCRKERQHSEPATFLA
jgi:hypothetical protein